MVTKRPAAEGLKSFRQHYSPADSFTHMHLHNGKNYKLLLLLLLLLLFLI
jgi:hypothetical protein